MDLSPDDRDYIARTIVGEAGNQSDEGQSAVAHVIMNRLTAGNYGQSISDVVLSPRQFSSWNDPRSMIAIDPKSKAYQKAAAIADKAASGEDDPTQGATHFYAPSGVSHAPSWAKNQTAEIGGHKFFAPNARIASSEPDLLGGWGAEESAHPAKSVEPDLLGSWQSNSPSAAETSPQPIPFHEGESPGESTARWVSEHQGAGAYDRAIQIGAGLNRGIGTVADTLAEGTGWAGEKGANVLSGAGIISPETAANVENWHQGIVSDINRENALWENASRNTPWAKVGQIGGQIAGSAPLIVQPEAMLPAASAGAAAIRSLPAVLQTALRGGVAGGETSALTSSGTDQGLGQQTLAGTILGGALGPLGYGIGKGLNAFARDFSGIDAATAKLADLARSKFGINVGTGQLTNSPMIRFFDSVLQRLPLTGHAADVAKQQGAFNRALVDTMQGPPGNNISPSVMAAVKDHLSNEIETTLPNLEAHLNPNVRARFQAITDATDYLPAEDGRIINKLKDDAIRQFTGVSASPGAASRATGPGRMTGSQIQSFIAKGSPLERAISSSNSNVAHYAGEIRETLLDAVGETPTGQAKRSIPYLQDLARYERARFGWKNMKTIEPLAEKSQTGNASPAALMTQVNKSYGNTAYGGGGNLADLARIGQRFLKEPPSSGTSERLAGLWTLAKLGGAAAGLDYFDPENFQRNALLGLSGLAAARGASGILRNKWLANALIRNAPGMPATPFAQNLSTRLNALAPGTGIVYRDTRAEPSFDDRFRGLPAPRPGLEGAVQ